METAYIIAVLMIVWVCIFIFIKLRYPFWNLQPVYHPYDIWRKLAVRPCVIDERIPRRNKYSTIPTKVKTYSYYDMVDQSDETNNIIHEIVNLLQCYYISSEHVLHTIHVDYLKTLMTGHLHEPFISIYSDYYYHSIEGTSHPVVACLLARPATIILCNFSTQIKVPIYFWDYICVHRDHKSTILRSVIQTHEYNQRCKNLNVSVSLFKKEGTLSRGIVPLIQYSSHTYILEYFQHSIQPSLKRIHTLPPHFVIVQITKENIDIYLDHIESIIFTRQYNFMITTSPANVLELIRSNIIYIYMLMCKKDVYGCYIFRDAKMIRENDTNQGEKVVHAIVSMKSSFCDKSLFYLGFIHSLYHLRQKDRYDIITMEMMGDQSVIYEYWKENQCELYKIDCAWYIYNYLYPQSPQSTGIIIL